jgi:hypothetical protein
MALLLPALPWIMGGLGVVGSLAETGTQVANLKSQQYAAENNALALRQQGDVVMQQSNLEEETQRKQARQVAGEQRAAMSQAGTGLNSSTNEKLMVQSAAAAEQDALNVRYGGLLEKHGLIAQADQESFQAKALKAQIKSTKASGWLKAVGAGFSGYTSSGGRLGSYGSIASKATKTAKSSGLTTNGAFGNAGY